MRLKLVEFDQFKGREGTIMRRNIRQKYTPAVKALTVNEVSDRLRADIETVYRELRAGNLKGYKVRSDWRIDECDLEDYITQGKLAALPKEFNYSPPRVVGSEAHPSSEKIKWV